MNPKSPEVASRRKPRLMLLERTDPTWVDDKPLRGAHDAPTRRMPTPDIDRLLHPEIEANGRYGFVFGRER